MFVRSRAWAEEESKLARDLTYGEFWQMFPDRTWTAYRVHRLRTWGLGSGSTPTKTEQKENPVVRETAPKVPSAVEQARDRLLNATVARQERSFYAEQGANLELFDRLTQSIQKIPAPSVRFTPRRSDIQPRTLCLLYSDAHRGQLIETNRLGGLGGYNLGIWEDRHNRLRDAVAEAGKMFGVDELVILGLGDLIDGQDIFKSQPFHIEEPVTDQIVGSAYRLAEDTAFYASIFPKVRHEYVYGNHARIGQKGQTPYAVNYEHLVYEIAKTACKLQRNVTWNPSDSWYKCVTVRDTRFVIVHGDNVRSSSGSPFSGMRKTKAQYVEMLNTPFDYLCVGHHHQAFSDEQVLANGSFVGASEFTAKILSVAGSPSQKIFVVEPTNGVTWKNDVALATAEELRSSNPFD